MASEFSFKITFNFRIPKFDDASIPLRDIANDIVEDSKRNIRQQVSPYGQGGKFVPLAKSTILKKKRLGYTNYNVGRALLATTAMYRNIVARQDPDNKNRWFVKVLAVGSPTRDLLALIHTEIGVPSKRGLIARPFLGISPKTRAAAQGRMQRWAKKQLEGGTPKYIKISLT